MRLKEAAGNRSSIHTEEADNQVYVVIPFDEGDSSSRQQKLVIAKTGRMLWWLLAGLTALLFFAAAMPSTMISVFGTTESTEVPPARQMILVIAAIGIALITAGLHRYFIVAKQLAELPEGARLLVSSNGVTIHHPALFTKDLRLPWSVISAVSFDAGSSDDQDKRFPLSQGKYHHCLFDSEDVNDLPVAVLSPEPVTPNMVICFNQPVVVRNAIAHITDHSFGPRGTFEPVVAPAEECDLIAVMMRIENIDEAAAALEPSGRVRELKRSDVEPVSN